MFEENAKLEKWILALLFTFLPPIVSFVALTDSSSQDTENKKSVWETNPNNDGLPNEISKSENLPTGENSQNQKTGAENCQSIDDPLLGLLKPDVTELVFGEKLMVPKKTKTYPNPYKPSNRSGKVPVVTTLYSVHTHDAVTIFKNKPVNIKELQYVFRCRGFGETTTVDKRLFETIIDASKHFKAKRVEVISAYRSPKFNDTLAKKGRRVALESSHTKGQAIDFRLENVSTKDLSKWLWENFDGGLGTYKGNDFVHIDVRQKRKWNGV